MLFEFKKKEIVHSCQSKAKCVMIKIIVAGQAHRHQNEEAIMAAKKNQGYGNESISSLKGADRVRKRPGVIFGSDGLEGCEHSVFEILSNSIDEAREGFGNRIIVTTYRDHSIEVQDFGRGIPVDYNPKEERYNWELVFCELYAGGKYNTNQGESYEFSLGLNGLGSCATSTLPNILMPRFIGMVTVIICILKREKISED